MAITTNRLVSKLKFNIHTTLAPSQIAIIISHRSFIIEHNCWRFHCADKTKPQKNQATQETKKKNTQDSAWVQWGSHFLKYFTTGNQWHHSREGWAALPHKEQQTGVGLQSDWKPELQSQCVFVRAHAASNTGERGGKLHTSAIDYRENNIGPRPL